MKPFLYTYLFFFLGFFSTVQAQENQVYFEKHDVKSGLPESTVREMVEDQKGYIWMATQNGLVRYDGYQYKVYQLGTQKTNLDPITNVQIIYLDKNNILWVSTSANGLFKYSRTTDTFTQYVYPEKDLAVIYTICTDDKDGNLWGFVTKDWMTSYLWKLDKNGKFEFFGKQFKNTNYTNASRFYSAFRSQSGKVWFGSNNGFYSYEGKNKPLKGYSTSNNPAQTKEVAYLYEAPSEPNIFWMVSFRGQAKDNKFVRFDAKANIYTSYSHNANDASPLNYENLDLGFVRSIFHKGIHEDKKNQLWFTVYDGLLCFNRKTATFDYFKSGFTFENPKAEKLFLDILETKEGNFWLTSGKGLVYFNPKTRHFERYLSDAKRSGAVLKDYDVGVKMFDHTGTLWLGFGWAGANKSNRIKSAFSIYKNNPKQVDSYPKEGGQFANGKNGHHWFNDQKYIYKWNQNTDSFTKTYSADRGETYLGRGCLTKDGNYCITTDKHLVFHNTKAGKKEKYPCDKIIKEGFIYSPFEDDNGLIWLQSNDKGIVCFNPKTKKFKAYPYRKNMEKSTSKNAGALDDVRVISTYVDRQHHFWVGTNYGSINLYDPIKDCFINYLDTNDKNMRCITSFYEDTSGRFWVGTYQSGLFEFDRKKGKIIRQLSEANGLLFNEILGINEDANGFIWVTTSRGISRIYPINLAVKNFPINTILTGNDINRNQQQFFKLDNGSFMTPLTDGIVVFNPKDLNANSFAPKVQVESIAVINPDAKTDEFKTMLTFGKKEIALTYQQNRIQFNYIGLHYDDPTVNTYAYKLDGYDNNWVKAGTQRTVTYTNLAPGEYTFHVKAANSDGVWSTENPAIKIIISPPWWKTWWAYMGYFFGFAGTMIGFAYWRAESLREKNKLLEERVTLRTKELETKSSDLESSLQDLKATQSQLIQSEKMASLGELTAGIAHEIQNPLNFVNNFSEVSSELLDEMNEELDKGDIEEAKAIAFDVKQNLEKINYHGKRADGIVKGMLQHSRSGSITKEPTDINKLADEYLRLAYHGLRAKDKSFNAELVTNFDALLPKATVLSQDIGRVLLNLFTNAFYATHQMQKQLGEGFKPVVSVTTSQIDNYLEIKVKDNGIGIPENIKDKILQPFFTTKPTGEGTGLGLSLSYDIVVKGHHGKILIDSKEKEYTIFTIQIPIE